MWNFIVQPFLLRTLLLGLFPWRPVQPLCLYHLFLLVQVVLDTKLLDMGAPKEILALAMDPPDMDNIQNTIMSLKEIGALLPTVSRVPDEARFLTFLLSKQLRNSWRLRLEDQLCSGLLAYDLVASEWKLSSIVFCKHRTSLNVIC